MKIAFVTLSTGDYIQGTEVLFYSILKHCGGIFLGDFIYLTDESQTTPYLTKIGAKNIFINDMYKDIQTRQDLFKEVSKKYAVFLLNGYDRIIMLDSDILCINEPTELFQDKLNEFSFWAGKDYACNKYYKQGLSLLHLDPNKIFNTGTMVINKEWLNEETHNKIRQFSIDNISYDGGDQGYINSYVQKMHIPIGYLDVKYNQALDPYFPVSGCPVFVHFSGGDGNPWRKDRGMWYKPRRPYFELWDKYKEEMNGN